MSQIAIRCHPSVPVDAGDLEDWLELQVDQLRSRVPHGAVRLARLTQQLPSQELHLGWLLELELPDGDARRIDAQLKDALRDMRLLGFHPTVLAPVASQAEAVELLSANGGGR
jgi:hypothetical protein